MGKICVAEFECKHNQEYFLWSDEEGFDWAEDIELLSNDKEKVTIKSFDFFIVKINDIEIYPSEQEYRFIDINWGPHDIIKLRPEMTQVEAKQFLLSFDNELSWQIRDAGIEVMKDLLKELDEADKSEGE